MLTAVIVATSCSRLPGSQRRTGVALPQFGMVGKSLICSGWRVVLASPAGGAVPVDVGSLSEEWAGVSDQLADSVALRDLDGIDGDTWVVLGGHGALVDLPEEPILARLLSDALQAGQPVLGVDHGAASFAGLMTSNGFPFVAGARVTGRSDAEERDVRHDRIPYLSTEQRLRAAGARYAAGPAWKPYVVVDGPLVTAQNSASIPLAISLLLSAKSQRQHAT
jgi:putative intracellular protease/amidase